MKRCSRVGLAIIIGLVAFTSIAHGEDPRQWRLHTIGDTVYRGIRPFTVRSVEMTEFYRPGVGKVEMIKTFIELSDAGLTSMTFNLEGFNEDGTALDQNRLDAIIRIKEEADYRWMPSICRVLGAHPDASPDFRGNAVKTAAEAFQGRHTALYWIDGPNSAELVQTFKAIAPELLVAAPEGGDVKVVESEDEVGEGPALLTGGVPDPIDSDLHCVLFNGEESLETYEAAVRDPRELDPPELSQANLTPEEKNAGFVSLFDGESLKGWSLTGPDKEAWTVQDGEIRWVRSGGGHVRTLQRFDDFILRLEWKIHRENGNSGLFLRAPRENRESKMGFEFQMKGDHGVEPDKNTTGAIYDVRAPKTNAVKPAGEWNTLEIRLEGPHFTATLNGQVVQKVNFDDHEELKYRKRNGFIALQDHQSPVSFRNIRIKEL